MYCITYTYGDADDADDSDDSDDDGGITAHTTTLYQTDGRDARARSADRPTDRPTTRPGRRTRRYTSTIIYLNSTIYVEINHNV